MKNFCVLISAVLALIFTPVKSEEIALLDRAFHNNTLGISFSGIFEVGSFARLAKKIDEINKSGKVVGLIIFSSEGGLVSEAILIGDLIRQMRIATVAPEITSESQMCASACALAWLGGVYRIGEVLVHRSYLPKSKSERKFSYWDDALSNSQGQIEDYLKRIRVPDSIFELAMAVPSTESSVLKSGTGIAVMDPVFEEYVISRCGTELLEDEREALKILVDAENEGKARNILVKVALRLLRDKVKKWQKCARSALFEAQLETQLPQ